MDRTNTLTMLGNRSGGYPYIELLVGKEKGKVFELTRDHLSIGRSEDSDILFVSDAVSRIHALLSREQDGWHIRDNQSKNGILVNGAKIENHRLLSGDLVQVGDFVFRFSDPTKSKVKARRKVNLAATTGLRALRGGPSPVWLFGVLFGGVVYFLLAPALVPSRVAVKSNLVISAPPSNPGADEGVTGPTAAETQLTAAAKALASAPEAAPSVDKAEAQAPKVADAAVRPITREDISIKTRKSGKVESGKTLKIYLEEGQHYLSEGDFESASIAFNFAILIDPRNDLAIQGMQAAQAGVREVTSVASPAREAQSIPSLEDKKRQVHQLFEKANAAVMGKRYQRAIDAAEEIRRIEIKGETVYLNEAKQIIDQAKLRQREEFEPFIKQANSMIAEKAFRAARELCDQLLKRDDAYLPAKECRNRAEDGLGRQASSGGAQ